MNKNFDKILLVGALVACGAGFGFYVLNKDKQTEVKSAYLGKNPEGKALAPTALPELTQPSKPWEQATLSEENEKWKYDLFSPVEVKWNPLINKYEPKGVRTTETPFGMQLVSISHPIYRLTLQSYLERKDEKTGRTNIEVLLYDSTAVSEDISGNQRMGKLIKASKGDNLEKEKIVVSDFAIKEVKNPDGTTSKQASVKIYDKELNRTFELTDKPYELKEITNIVLARADDPSQTWTLHKIGDEIKNDLGTFTLKGIDFDSRTVNLSKLYKPNPRKPEQTETRDLSVQVSAPSAQAPKGTTTTRL